MRAIYIEGFTGIINEKIKIDREQAKHLIKSVRIERGEKLLILNGKGERYLSIITDIEKKSLEVEITNVETEAKRVMIDLALSMPKKDAFEEIVRKSVEIGIDNIIPIQTEYSSRDSLKVERVQKIIESGMIQSNNPFRLSIGEIRKIAELNEISSHYEKVIYFCPHLERCEKPPKIFLEEKVLMIIGAEGGLSDKEEQELKMIDNIFFVNLPSYILRAPTATCVASGLIMGIRG